MLMMLAGVSLHRLTYCSKGIFPIDGRHALVSSKNENSILLIDYLVGGVVNENSHQPPPFAVVGRREIDHSMTSVYSSTDPHTWLVITTPQPHTPDS